MLIREVMVTRVFTVRETDLVRSAVLLMLNHHFGALPVTDDENKIIGIISLRDVMLPLYPNYGDYIHDAVHTGAFLEMEEGYQKVLDKTVGEIMTRRPTTISPDEPVLKAASFMGMKNLRRIPVVESDKLVGMVSIADINRGFFELR